MSFTDDLATWNKYLARHTYLLADLEAAIDCVEDDKLRPEIVKLLRLFCEVADDEYGTLLEMRYEFENELNEANEIIEGLEREIEPDYKKAGLTGDEPMLSKERNDDEDNMC